MKKLQFTFWLLIFCCFSGIGQSTFDSLSLALKKAKEDTSKVIILGELAAIFAKADPEKSLKYSTEGIELGAKLNFTDGRFYCLLQMTIALQNKGIYHVVDSLLNEVLPFYKNKKPNLNYARTLLLKGSNTERQGDFDKALIFHQKALKIGKSNDYRQITSDALNNIAIVYYRKADYPRAIEYYLEAIKWNDQSKPNQSIANIYRNIGIVYKKIGAYDKALEYYYQALKINEKLGNDQRLAENWNSIGTVFSELDRPSDSNKAYKTALGYLKKQSPSRLFLNLTNNIGLQFAKQGQLDSAYAYYNKAIAICDQLEGYVRRGVYLFNIGTIHNEKKEFDLALTYFEKAIQAEPGSEDLENKARVWGQMGTVYLKKRAYNKSIQYLEKSLELSQSLGLKKQMSYALKHLAKVYKELNQPSKSLEYHLSYIEVEDSLFNKEKAAQIQQLEIARKEELHLKKLHALENGINRSTIIDSYIFWIALFVLIIGLLFFILQTKKTRKAQKQKDLLTIQKNWLELQTLRNQFKPHFVFNALASIQHLLMARDTQKAIKYVDEFSKLMRDVLENAEGDWISLEEEIDFLRRYLALEQMRTRNGFVFEIKTGTGIDTSDILIPNLLLQIIIENAIWHGVSPKKEKGFIGLHFRKVDSLLIMEVKDNGVGRQLVDNNGHKSKGLELIRNRIEALNQKKGMNLKWRIEDLKSSDGSALGTKVVLTHNIGY